MIRVLNVILRNYANFAILSFVGTEYAHLDFLPLITWYSYSIISYNDRDKEVRKRGFEK